MAGERIKQTLAALKEIWGRSIPNSSGLPLSEPQKTPVNPAIELSLPPNVKELARMVHILECYERYVQAASTRRLSPYVSQAKNYFGISAAMMEEGIATGLIPARGVLSTIRGDLIDAGRGAYQEAKKAQERDMCAAAFGVPLDRTDLEYDLGYISEGLGPSSFSNRLYYQALERLLLDPFVQNELQITTMDHLVEFLSRKAPKYTSDEVNVPHGYVLSFGDVPTVTEGDGGFPKVLLAEPLPIESILTVQPVGDRAVASLKQMKRAIETGYR